MAYPVKTASLDPVTPDLTVGVSGSGLTLPATSDWYGLGNARFTFCCQSPTVDSVIFGTFGAPPTGILAYGFSPGDFARYDASSVDLSIGGQGTVFAGTHSSIATGDIYPAQIFNFDTAVSPFGPYTGGDQAAVIGATNTTPLDFTVVLDDANGGAGFFFEMPIAPINSLDPSTANLGSFDIGIVGANVDSAGALTAFQAWEKDAGDFDFYATATCIITNQNFTLGNYTNNGIDYPIFHAAWEATAMGAAFISVVSTPEFDNPAYTALLNSANYIYRANAENTAGFILPFVAGGIVQALLVDPTWSTYQVVTFFALDSGGQNILDYAIANEATEALSVALDDLGNWYVVAAPVGSMTLGFGLAATPVPENKISIGPICSLACFNPCVPYAIKRF